MGLTVSHQLSMTSPNDTNYENQPQHWNSAHAFTLDLSLGTNTAVTGGLITGNSSGLSINMYGAPISSYENQDALGASSLMTLNGASVSLAAAFILPQPGSFSFLRFPALMTTGSATLAANASITTAAGYLFSTWNAVIYKLATGASSQSLTSVASGSVGASLTNSISAGGAGNSTQYSITQNISINAYGSNVTAGTSTQYSQSAASATLSTGLYTNFSSNRFIDINFASSLSPGPYWLILGYSSSSTTSGQGASALTGASVAYSANYCASQINLWWVGFGDTAGSSGGWLGAGSFSTAGGGTTAAFALSAISSSASNNRFYFQMLRSA